jgi:hypothetical protein
MWVPLLVANENVTFSLSRMVPDQLHWEVSLIHRRALNDRIIAAVTGFAAVFSMTIAAVVAAMTLIASHQDTAAYPVYSRQTNLPCEQCHTRSGKLTAFGETFKANGNKLPESKP